MLTNKSHGTPWWGGVAGALSPAWGSRGPPSHMPACPFLPHRYLESLQISPVYFWKSGIGGEGKIVELYINLSELKVEFGFQFLYL